MAHRLGTKLNCINAELALIGFRPDQAASFPSAAPLSLPVQLNSGDGRRVFAEAGNDHLQPEVTLNNGRWGRRGVLTLQPGWVTHCVCRCAYDEGCCSGHMVEGKAGGSPLKYLINASNIYFIAGTQLQSGVQCHFFFLSEVVRSIRSESRSQITSSFIFPCVTHACLNPECNGFTADFPAAMKSTFNWWHLLP